MNSKAESRRDGTGFWEGAKDLAMLMGLTAALSLHKLYETAKEKIAERLNPIPIGCRRWENMQGSGIQGKVDNYFHANFVVLIANDGGVINVLGTPVGPEEAYNSESEFVPYIDYRPFSPIESTELTGVLNRLRLRSVGN